jgi:VWFA-related protein
LRPRARCGIACYLLNFEYGSGILNPADPAPPFGGRVNSGKHRIPCRHNQKNGIFLKLLSILLVLCWHAHLSEAREHTREPHAGSNPRELERSGPGQGIYAVSVDVDSVFLNLSVRDRNTNRSLSKLRKSDFLVYEDGVRQEINQFLTMESPFNLLLLLDVSGSTGSYLKMMKQAAIEFTHEINESDRIAIATFNSRVRLEQKFTGARDKAEQAVRRIRSGGGTAFYDALMTCINRYMKGIRGRSSIVVFTDGIDNKLEGGLEGGSRTGFDDLFRTIQEIDTIVYIIFLNTENPYPAFARGSGGSPLFTPFPFPPAKSDQGSNQDGDDAIFMQAKEQLQLIADQTGGRVYSPAQGIMRGRTGGSDLAPKDRSCLARLKRPCAQFCRPLFLFQAIAETVRFAYGDRDERNSQSAALSTCASSSAVSSTGFPFMLLDFCARAAMTERSFSVIPKPERRGTERSEHME